MSGLDPSVLVAEDQRDKWAGGSLWDWQSDWYDIEPWMMLPWLVRYATIAGSSQP